LLRSPREFRRSSTNKSGRGPRSHRRKDEER
jgi:hypothetical protein